MHSRCTPYHRLPTGSLYPRAGVVPDGPGHHTAPAGALADGHHRSCFGAGPSLSRVPRPRRTAAPLHEESSAAVPELAFRDGIMDRIRMREQRFDERAYLFVLGALEYCQQRLPERRHISGRELALACRDLALDRFGVLARLVLESWGIHNSLDIGDVVFTLVELELLMSQPTDSRDEFSDVFDFDQAFERDYPWCAQFV
jgi:uncharacterized repeat protein (TIGR04138 family)